MTLTALHQWVPTFAGRDAVGGHVIELQKVIREKLGLASEIFATDRHPGVRDISLPLRRHKPDPTGRSAIVYHLSVGSDMVSRLAGRPEPVIIDYHNITPVEYFRAWEPGAAYAVQMGLRQTAELADRAHAAMADSAYSERELRHLGYRNTGVVPIILDDSRFEHDVDESLVRRLGDGGPLWLFVGRIAPNKCQHDIVSAFAVYRRHFRPDARLALVGGTSAPSYLAAIEALAADLGVADAVTITGSVSDAELGAWYRVADVFVVLSEHEGFCVPLIEAMHHSVPVVAHRSSAVTETGAGGSLLMKDKNPITVAATVDRVLSDDAVRDALVEGGRRRARDFAPEVTRQRAVEFLTPIVDGTLR